MIKLPVKDNTTIPWMSKREIPAIKAVLSSWREMRKDKSLVEATRAKMARSDHAALMRYADYDMHEAARCLKNIAAIDERMRKEANNG